jgi:alkaline phosphatase D
MTGDITSGRVIVWSKVDRPARMLVEYATTETFRDVQRMIGPAALEDSDFTARLELRNLPPDQRIFYQVLFQDLHDINVVSEPVYGTFRTPSALHEGQPRSVSFVFSGDEAGQGWGINLDWGGVSTV